MCSPGFVCEIALRKHIDAGRDELMNKNHSEFKNVQAATVHFRLWERTWRKEKPCEDTVRRTVIRS